MPSLKTLLGTAALLMGLAIVPTAQGQISIGINLGGPPPVCTYGYYDYAPYACAPYGFYGPGYFYNGIFLGVGPWAGWGYAHGWGSHRFVNAGGGRYRGRGGDLANHSRYASAHYAGGSARGNARASHAGGARGSTSHASHPTNSRGGAAHGASHGSTSRGGAHGASHGSTSHSASSHGDDKHQ